MLKLFGVTLLAANLLMASTHRTATPAKPGISLEASCPVGFDFVPEVRGCYKPQLTPMSWDTAGHDCKVADRNAHLLVVNDAAEQKAVADWIKRNYADTMVKSTCADPSRTVFLWTAGQRVVPFQNTTFVWKDTSLDGSFTKTRYMGYHDWEPNQPDFWRQESCLCLDNVYDYRWNDYICSKEICSICEFDLF